MLELNTFYRFDVYLHISKYIVAHSQVQIDRETWAEWLIIRPWCLIPTEFRASLIGPLTHAAACCHRIPRSISEYIDGFIETERIAFCVCILQVYANEFRKSVQIIGFNAGSICYFCQNCFACAFNVTWTMVLHNTCKNIRQSGLEIPNVQLIVKIEIVARLEQFTKTIDIAARNQIFDGTESVFQFLVAFFATDNSNRLSGSFFVFAEIDFGVQWCARCPRPSYHVRILLTEPCGHCATIWSTHSKHATSCIQFRVKFNRCDEMSQIGERLIDGQITDVDRRCWAWIENLKCFI